jgi:hypothetical protein
MKVRTTFVRCFCESFMSLDVSNSALIADTSVPVALPKRDKAPLDSASAMAASSVSMKRSYPGGIYAIPGVYIRNSWTDHSAIHIGLKEGIYGISRLL